MLQSIAEIMSSADVFYGIQDVCYWLFENTLEPWGDWPWRIVMVGGFFGFALWMKLQIGYNKQAAANPNQIK